MRYIEKGGLIFDTNRATYMDDNDVQSRLNETEQQLKDSEAVIDFVCDGIVDYSKEVTLSEIRQEIKGYKQKYK